MPRYKNILLTGGSGALGRTIVGSGLFPGILSPSHGEMDITKREEVARFFNRHTPDAVIHCAAMTNMIQCEENPEKAIQTNILGTSHLAEAVQKLERKDGKSKRFVYISTDGVYPCTEGNYSESDPTIPYNTYGWTKLGGECVARTLRNVCIIRTSFFNPENIRYTRYATNKYSSRLPAQYLPKAIAFLLDHDFIGAVNIGGKRESDYEKYRAIQSSVQPCLYEDIIKKSPVKVARDSSMNCSLWRELAGNVNNLQISI